MTIHYNVTPQGISFIVDSRSRVIPRTHPSYEEIKQAVFAQDVEKVKRLTDLSGLVAKTTNGDVKVLSDDTVIYKDFSRKVPIYLAKRILDNIKNNEPVDAVCRFTEKLMQNPNSEILEDLFKWIEVGNMPICDDGDFIAYKKVKTDYTSVHVGPDGPMLQAIGTTVSMPREDCDSNRSTTCSTGLHFCSYEYLAHFGTGTSEAKVIILKINPMNVVAIPADYNDTKGRCCEFSVIGEVPEEDAKRFFKGTVVSGFGTWYGNNTANTNSTEEDETEKEDESSWDNEGSSSEDYSWGDDESTNTSSFGTFYSKDRAFSAQEILDGYNKFGKNKNKAALYLCVPPSTFRGWLKKILND